MKTVLDAFDNPDWVIQGWKIKFLLSEKLLHRVKQHTGIPNWFEDPTITDTWAEQISICFTSIQKFHDTFGMLPQVGDRLFDEGSGMLVQERSINGDLMSITFTLTN